MIELSQYSKIDSDLLLKRVPREHTDSRLKIIGYVSLALVVSLVGVTYQLGRTTFLGYEEKSLRIFEDDSNTETMKAFESFMGQFNKTYGDNKAEMAKRYRNFKNNAEKLRHHIRDVQHMPFAVTLSN